MNARGRGVRRIMLYERACFLSCISVPNSEAQWMEKNPVKHSYCSIESSKQNSRYESIPASTLCGLIFLPVVDHHVRERLWLISSVHVSRHNFYDNAFFWKAFILHLLILLKNLETRLVHTSSRPQICPSSDCSNCNPAHGSGERPPWW